MNLTILAMDLSLAFPAFAILRVVNNAVEILDIKYTDNKRFAKLSHSERLLRIANTISEVATDHPDINLCVREKGFSRYAATTQALFKVVGVSDLEILRLLKVKNIHEISPTSVKKYITGDGKASKLDVDMGVRKYLIDRQKDYTFLTDDMSDAVAVGMAFLLYKNLLIKC